jgi:copper chaperone CopZ
MKKMVMMMMVALFVSVASAKTVKNSFVVNGKCSSCQARIEKAAKSVDGVKTASWNIKSHKLVITYDDAKTSPKKVQQVIAKAGHDAGNIKASDADYNRLPACCRYRSK